MSTLFSSWCANSSVCPDMVGCVFRLIYIYLLNRGTVLVFSGGHCHIVALAVWCTALMKTRSKAYAPGEPVSSLLWPET